jgi:ABC-type bacteriocin/lantibiotic exporter with double-glycine peptidase domain
LHSKWTQRGWRNPVNPFLLILIPFFLFSCAKTVPITDLTKLHAIKNVPFYPQEMLQCGPASLSGVLNFWGTKVSPEEIAREIYSPSARGTLTIDMVLYAERKGFAARQYKGDMEDIRKNVDAGRPLIVLVDYGFSVYEKNHFMVVVGYNEDGLLVNSGKEREKFIPVKDFLAPWKEAEFWTLLITPKKNEK